MNLIMQRYKLQNDDDDIPPEDFRLLPVHPEAADLNINSGMRRPFLRRNKGMTTREV